MTSLHCGAGFGMAVMPEVGDEVLLDALGGAEGVAVLLGTAAVSQAIPVAGEVEDLVLALGVLSAGLSLGQIYQGLKELYGFKQACCGQAETPEDLKKAGVLFADAVGKIGVNALGAVLGARAVKGARSTAAAKELTSQLATKPNEAFFWSGRSLRPDGTYAGGELNAANLSKTRGGTTLETIIADRGIEMPPWDKNNPAAVKAWEEASSAYAKGANGDVHVVLGSDLRPGNIWENKEFGELKNNPNVNSITAIDPATGVERLIWQR